MTDVLMPSTGQMPRVSPMWLDLRETADAAARSAELVCLVRRRLAGRAQMTIHDLGCGTGSMGRWLAPQLAGPQHWIMHDRDDDLLEWTVIDMVDKAEDGAAVTVQTVQRDITELTSDDLAGVDLVTASALLDLLTADELERVVTACVGARCAALWTTSVVGRVDLSPADPLDAEFAAAFNAHQRRMVAGRRLLGPDAVAAAVDAFARHGVATVVRPSPWRLGGDDVDLLSEWLTGWLDAACEQRPDLAGLASYERRRLAEAFDGRLDVVVHHQDLFAHHE
jgi:Methyltransferase domain